MNKVKVSTGLASLVLVAGVFTGIGTLLTIIALLLLFCEVDNIKGVIVRVLSFVIGVELFTMLWGVLSGGYDLLYGSIDKIIDIINYYSDSTVTADKLYSYLLNPLKTIFALGSSIISYVVLVIKFIFVVSFLEGKAVKENFISKFVNKFVDKAVAFVNGIEG